MTEKLDIDKIKLSTGEGDGIFDEINNALPIMEYEHKAVHDGIAYHINVYSTVTNGTPKYCQFKTGAGYIHLKQKGLVNGADELLCQFIEVTSITDGTTEVKTYNRNRNSSNASTMKIYSNPTNIVEGTEILDMDYLSGTNQSAGPPSESNFEWLLKPNTSYVYKLECLSAGTATFLAKLNFYEHIISA